jgi:predicted membrane-bound mannosyltransferase
MLSILGVFSAGTWAKIGAVIALAVLVAVGIQHIKDAQKSRDAAVAAAALAKQVATNARVESAAQEAIDESVNTYELEATAEPAVPALPNLMCHDASGSGTVSGGAGATGTGHAATSPGAVLPAESTIEPGAVTVNQSGILSDAERADQLAAQVRLLQSIILSYQAEGVVAGHAVAGSDAVHNVVAVH